MALQNYVSFLIMLSPSTTERSRLQAFISLHFLLKLSQETRCYPIRNNKFMVTMNDSHPKIRQEENRKYS